MDTAQHYRTSSALLLRQPQKSIATFTVGSDHMNCFRNSISGPFSFSRENPISKYPAEYGAQRDTSTDTTAVHFRSSDGGCISEN